MTDKLITYLQHQYCIIKETIDDETVDKMVDTYLKTLNDDLVMNRETIIDDFIEFMEIVNALIRCDETLESVIKRKTYESQVIETVHNYCSMLDKIEDDDIDNAIIEV